MSEKYVNKADLISRQAAIDIVSGIDRHFVKYINELPSVTPKPCEDAISRAEVHDLLATWLSDKLNENTREVLEVIDGKVEDMPSVTPKQSDNTMMDTAIDEWRGEMDNAIKRALEKQRTGHWIIIDDCEQFIAKCSECGRIEDSRMIRKYPYCHCGAKMESENMKTESAQDA